MGEERRSRASGVRKWSRPSCALCEGPERAAPAGQGPVPLELEPERSVLVAPRGVKKNQKRGKRKQTGFQGDGTDLCGAGRARKGRDTGLSLPGGLWKGPWRGPICSHHQMGTKQHRPSLRVDFCARPSSAAPLTPAEKAASSCPLCPLPGSEPQGWP